MSKVISVVGLVAGAVDGYYNAQGIPLSNHMDNLLFHAAPLANGVLIGAQGILIGGAGGVGLGVSRYSSGLENVVKGSIGGAAGAITGGIGAGGVATGITYVYTAVGYTAGYIAGKLL